MEEEQYGFTQNAGMGTPASQLHRQLKTQESETKKSGLNLRTKRRRLTLEDFQGKVMACMVLGIPMKIKWRKLSGFASTQYDNSKSYMNTEQLQKR